MVPGSLSGGATEIYQEGIRIPAIRIARDGKLVPEVAEPMFANMRGADDRRGDLSAMEGACRIAEGKVRRIIERWGGATFAEASDLLLDRAEAIAGQSTCNQCRTYGRLLVLGAGTALATGVEASAWMRVQCRQCGNQWLIQ